MAIDANKFGSLVNSADNNKNGHPDIYAFDTDSNKKTDLIVFDINEDKYVDKIHFDKNENSIDELVISDVINSKSNHILYEFDEDENSIVETLGYDFDRDGKIDKLKSLN